MRKECAGLTVLLLIMSPMCCCALKEETKPRTEKLMDLCCWCLSSPLKKL